MGKRAALFAALVSSVVLFAACDRTTESTTTSVGTSVPSTTIEAPSPTSTTTSRDPGDVAYAFERNLRLDFDLSESIVSLGTVQGDAAAVEALDRLGYFDFAIDVTVDGEATVLLVDGPTNGWEVIVTRTVESAVANDEPLPRDLLRSLGGIETPPVVVAADGSIDPTKERMGAPSAFGRHHAVMPLPVLGPELPEGPLEVGDTWSFPYEATTVEAELVAFEESDLGPVVVIEVRADLAAVQVDPAARSWPGAEGVLSFLDLSPGLARAGAAVMYEPSTAVGTYRLLTDDGTLVASETEWSVVQVVELTATDGTAVAVTELTVSTERELVARDVVSGAQARRILADFHLDGFDDADTIFEFPSYDVEELDAETTSLLTSLIAGVSQELFAGYGSGHLIGAGTEAGVLVVTLGPFVAGEPDFAEVIVEFALGVPRQVSTVAGHDVVAFEWEGEPVVAWSNNTHLVFVAGTLAEAEPVLADLIAEVGYGYRWPVGDCLELSLQLPFAPFGAVFAVHCLAGHTHEVIGSWALPEGPDDPFPTDLGDRVSTLCGQAFFDHFGRLPSESTLGLITYLPDEIEWAEGDRYAACLAHEVDESGDHPVSVRLSTEPGAYAFDPEVGDCLVAFSDVGPCDSRHVWEVVGIAELDAAADAPYPGADAVAAEIDSVCEELRDAYGIVEGEGIVEVTGFIDPFEWSKGKRTAVCRAFVVLEDFIVDIRGSLQGGWTVVGDESSS